MGSYFSIEPSGSSIPVPRGAAHLLLVVGHYMSIGGDDLAYDNCGDVTATTTKQQ